MAKNLQSTTIIPYRGFARNDMIYVSGHVFSAYAVKPLAKNSSIRNFFQMVKRYSMIPSPETEILIHIFGKEYPVKSDCNGLFKAIIPIDRVVTTAVIEYSASVCGQAKRFVSHIFHSTMEKVGVLSDIDDTILLSYVNQWYKMLYLLASKNALTRNPVPQINRILDAVRNYNQQILPTDFFYVSNSEWNLYDFLVDFFRQNNLPDGTFMLQRFKKGLRDAILTPQRKDDHKYDSIRHVLDFYPDKEFILVGDNGQRDMEIYSRVCNEYAQRIRSVVIRDLGRKKYHRKNKCFEQTIVDLNIPIDYIF